MLSASPSAREILPPGASRAGLYDATFGLCYVANMLVTMGVSLLFRYADFIRFLGGSELQLGLIVGVDFASGVPGMLLFVLLGGAWGLAFTGLPYAVALKTGNPAAVNSSFLLFFPFSFLTTSFVPKESLSGWLSAVADYNPVTYLFVGMRSLVDEGWAVDALAQAVAAILGVATVCTGLALLALRGRVKRA